MSIYRRRRNGKRSKLYTAEFEYRRKVYRRGGFPDRETASFWLNSEMLKLRRGEVGFIKAMYRAQVLPLIADFAAYLRKRGRGDDYVYTAEMRLKRLAGECAWRTLGDITAEGLALWLDGETQQKDRTKKAGKRTMNQYRDIAGQFGRWLVKPAGKLPSNPLADVERVPAKHNDTYRRAGTEDELNALLATCGQERRLYYLCRIYTPMRGGTYAGLTWRMAHLDAAPPFFKTPAEINKSRKEEKHTIRYDVAQELRQLRKSAKAKADDAIFPNAPTLDDFKADLLASGVPFELAKNHRRLDYHALRRTAIRIAKRAGVSLDDASLLLGHRDVRTTRKYYDEDSVDPDIGAIVEKLPTLGKLRRAE